MRQEAPLHAALIFALDLFKPGVYPLRAGCAVTAARMADVLFPAAVLAAMLLEVQGQHVGLASCALLLMCRRCKSLKESGVSSDRFQSL
jgi:hypothetical protein